jgi:hypothetical protein
MKMAGRNGNSSDLVQCTYTSVVLPALWAKSENRDLRNMELSGRQSTALLRSCVQCRVVFSVALGLWSVSTNFPPVADASSLYPQRSCVLTCALDIKTICSMIRLYILLQTWFYVDDIRKFMYNTASYGEYVLRGLRSSWNSSGPLITIFASCSFRMSLIYVAEPG